MARSSLVRVTGNVHAPAEARRFAATFLAENLTAPLTSPSHDLAMIVSELVTNSVRAGAETVAVQLTLSGNLLRIEVTDDVAGWPKVRTARADDATGRGLPLVDALADDWGVSRVPGTGKQVWATLRVL